MLCEFFGRFSQKGRRRFGTGTTTTTGTPTDRHRKRPRARARGTGTTGTIDGADHGFPDQVPVGKTPDAADLAGATTARRARRARRAHLPDVQRAVAHGRVAGRSRGEHGAVRLARRRRARWGRKAPTRDLRRRAYARSSPFDVTNLPPSATIAGVKLRIARKSLIGRIGPGEGRRAAGLVGATADLGKDDYEAAATVAGAAQFAPRRRTERGPKSTCRPRTFAAVASGTVSSARRRQIVGPGFLTFHGAADGSLAPQLVISYH